MQVEQITEIEVTYCARYNGCYLIAEDGFDMVDDYDADISKIAETIIDQIIEFAGDDCDEDGEYQGSPHEVKEFAFNLLKKEFPAAKLSFDFDEMSS